MKIDWRRRRRCCCSYDSLPKKAMPYSLLKDKKREKKERKKYLKEDYLVIVGYSLLCFAFSMFQAKFWEIKQRPTVAALHWSQVFTPWLAKKKKKNLYIYQLTYFVYLKKILDILEFKIPRKILNILTSKFQGFGSTQKKIRVMLSIQYFHHKS